ncbi:MAG: PGPGW domain-containing protein [Ilumatobacteraceae bacterium]|jgi:hypothetical protein
MSINSWYSPLAWLRWIARNTRRLVVTLLGFGVLGAGITMLVLPGPGVLIIIVGLAILATEFTWAAIALERASTTAASATTKVTNSRSGKLLLALSALSLIIGGAVVATVYGRYRLIGFSVLLAGTIALATLLPKVQRWVEAKSSPSQPPVD